MFKNNLKIFIKHYGGGVSDFSRIVGLTTDSIYNYQNGKREPDIETLVQIVQKYKEVKGKTLNLHWLITGEGEMFIKENAISEDDAKVEFNELVSRLSTVEKIVSRLEKDKQA